MAKAIKSWFCTSCGAESPKWEGKCPSCFEWNTLQEELIIKTTAKEESKKIWSQKRLAPGEKIKPILLNEVKSGTTERQSSMDAELDRVLGGGIVPGSIILIGGEPGIGKSTLMLQLALAFKGKVLYASGEESEEQIKMRAERFGKALSACYLMAETNLNNLLMQASQLEPDLVIVDSIQTLNSQFIDSPPGSVSQVRECAAELQRYAKEMNVPVFVVGHITKD